MRHEDDVIEELNPARAAIKSYKAPASGGFEVTVVLPNTDRVIEFISKAHRNKNGIAIGMSGEVVTEKDAVGDDGGEHPGQTTLDDLPEKEVDES